MIWNRFTVVGALAASLMAVGLGAAMVSPPKPQEMADLGPGIRVEVIPPVEREPVPGQVMDVGEVVDGYEHRPYVRVNHDMDYIDDDIPTESEDVAAWNSWEVPSRRHAVVTVPAEIQPEGAGSAFGFDRPQPDYARARQERHARIEAQAIAVGERIASYLFGPSPDEQMSRESEMFY